MGRGKRLAIDDMLRRRDPQGFYVIPIDRKGYGQLTGILSGERDVEVEEVGDVIVVRVRSRSLAARIAKWAVKRGFLRPG